MVVRGLFSSTPPRLTDSGDAFAGWTEEESAVLERPASEDAPADRITSEFPESIEAALRIAAETHGRSPLAPELPAEAEPYRRG